MHPDAGEDDGWANLLKEIDAQTPPLIDIRIVAKLRDMVTARIPQQFEIAKIVLGEEEARRQWKAAPAKKKMGRPKGVTNPERDRFLLWLYDELADRSPSQIKVLPQFIGRFAHLFLNPHVLPASIASHVRRLRKTRPPGLINRTPR
jgi:hypothetical protein